MEERAKETNLSHRHNQWIGPEPEGLKEIENLVSMDSTPHLISLGPDLIFETNHPSEVGLTMQGFLTMRFNPLGLSI